MKLTVFQFEGTPEELDASQVLKELAAQHHSPTSVVAQGVRDGALPARIPGVADEGQEALRQLLSGNPARDLFVQFLAETTSWENVSVHGIKRKNAPADAPLDYSRYLRLRRQGSQFGGFAYAYAERGTINLRLNYSKQQLAELGTSTARTLTTGHREYRVSVDVSDEKSLAHALQLAKLAYDAT